MFKIYVILVIDRDDKTILRTMASVKQALLDTKSRLAFKIKQESDLV